LQAERELLKRRPTGLINGSWRAQTPTDARIWDSILGKEVERQARIKSSDLSNRTAETKSTERCRRTTLNESHITRTRHFGLVSLFVRKVESVHPYLENNLVRVRDGGGADAHQT
jgi:hypothetical protein